MANSSNASQLLYGTIIKTNPFSDIKLPYHRDKAPAINERFERVEDLLRELQGLSLELQKQQDELSQNQTQQQQSVQQLEKQVSRQRFQEECHYQRFRSIFEILTADIQGIKENMNSMQDSLGQMENQWDQWESFIKSQENGLQDQLHAERAAQRAIVEALEREFPEALLQEQMSPADRAALRDLEREFPEALPQEGSRSSRDWTEEEGIKSEETDTAAEQDLPRVDGNSRQEELAEQAVPWPSSVRAASTDESSDDERILQQLEEEIRRELNSLEHLQATTLSASKHSKYGSQTEQAEPQVNAYDGWSSSDFDSDAESSVLGLDSGPISSAAARLGTSKMGEDLSGEFSESVSAEYLGRSVSSTNAKPIDIDALKTEVASTLEGTSAIDMKAYDWVGSDTRSEDMKSEDEIQQVELDEEDPEDWELSINSEVEPLIADFPEAPADLHDTVSNILAGWQKNIESSQSSTVTDEPKPKEEERESDESDVDWDDLEPESKQGNLPLAKPEDGAESTLISTWQLVQMDDETETLETGTVVNVEEQTEEEALVLSRLSSSAAVPKAVGQAETGRESLRLIDLDYPNYGEISSLTETQFQEWEDALNTPQDEIGFESAQKNGELSTGPETDDSILASSQSVSFSRLHQDLNGWQGEEVGQLPWLSSEIDAEDALDGERLTEDASKSHTDGELSQHLKTKAQIEIPEQWQTGSSQAAGSNLDETGLTETAARAQSEDEASDFRASTARAASVLHQNIHRHNVGDGSNTEQDEETSLPYDYITLLNSLAVSDPTSPDEEVQKESEPQAGEATAITTEATDAIKALEDFQQNNSSELSSPNTLQAILQSETGQIENASATTVNGRKSASGETQKTSTLLGQKQDLTDQALAILESQPPERPVSSLDEQLSGEISQLLTVLSHRDDLGLVVSQQQMEQHPQSPETSLEKTGGADLGYDLYTRLELPDDPFELSGGVKTQQDPAVQKDVKEPENKGYLNPEAAQVMQEAPESGQWSASSRPLPPSNESGITEVPNGSIHIENTERAESTTAASATDAGTSLGDVGQEVPHTHSSLPDESLPLPDGLSGQQFAAKAKDVSHTGEHENGIPEVRKIAPEEGIPVLNINFSAINQNSGNLDLDHLVAFGAGTSEPTNDNKLHQSNWDDLSLEDSEQFEMLLDEKP